MMMKNNYKHASTIYKLLKIWEKNPELRLGQLIWNAFDGKDFFYVTDEDFIKQIEENEHRSSSSSE